MAGWMDLLMGIVLVFLTIGIMQISSKPVFIVQPFYSFVKSMQHVSECVNLNHYA